MNNRPLVSILVLVYNAERYLSPALDSILMQKCSFPLEIIVGEDCSTDGSRAILRRYAEQYPQIAPLYHEQNKGVIGNFLSVFNAVNGEYIAFLEADDYWIDPLKLQKQVDFLEKNPDYGFVYTNYDSFNQETAVISSAVLTSQTMPEGDCRDRFIKGSRGVMTLTMFFRRTVFENGFLNFIDDTSFQAGDFPICMWAAFELKVKYLPDSTAVYRVHGSSITNSHSGVKRWRFMRSHVYMRKKFLQVKGYRPEGYERIELNVRKEVLKSAFQNVISNGFVCEAYRYIGRHRALTAKDRLFYLGSHNRIINKLIKGLFVLLRINPYLNKK